MKTPEPKELKDIGALLCNPDPAVRVINLITLYRTVTFPLLLFFVITENIAVYKWLLLTSFLTDAVDGFLARKYKATSILGSKLDSIGDDLTILAGMAGLAIMHPDFIMRNAAIFLALLVLFFVQLGLALYRYKKISTFHTYMAKAAAVISALFLLSVFFFEQIYSPLFYAAAAITGLELIEEIVLVVMLRDYRSNAKGLYWVLKERR